MPKEFSRKIQENRNKLKKLIQAFLLEYFCHICSFPGKVRVISSKVAIRCCAAVDGSAEIESLDDGALAHYREVLQALRQRRIEPIVTLHHYTNPQWVAKAGGWKDTSQLWKTYGHARNDPRITDVLTSGTQETQLHIAKPKRIDKITA